MVIDDRSIDVTFVAPRSHSAEHISRTKRPETGCLKLAPAQKPRIRKRSERWRWGPPGCFSRRRHATVIRVASVNSDHTELVGIAAPDEFADLFRRNRATDKVSLNLVTIALAQKANLLRRLDTLCHDLQA